MEGELLVWNDDSKQTERFRKIREHVRRAGHRLGCAQDSPVQEGEHLMVMLYDLLLLDDDICVREPHDRRHQQLRSTVRCIQGPLDIGTSTKIDFGSRGAADEPRRRVIPLSAKVDLWVGKVNWLRAPNLRGEVRNFGLMRRPGNRAEKD
jgi:ATP-dependent DNA ligase